MKDFTGRTVHLSQKMISLPNWGQEGEKETWEILISDFKEFIGRAAYRSPEKSVCPTGATRKRERICEMSAFPNGSYIPKPRS